MVSRYADADVDVDAGVEPSVVPVRPGPGLKKVEKRSCLAAPLVLGCGMSGRKSKAKGYRLEALIAKKCQAAGFEKSQRAWGSNGRALGWHEEVDNILSKKGWEEPVKIQAKARRALPQYLQIPESCDVTVVKQDRGEELVIMRWSDFIRCVKVLGDEFGQKRDPGGTANPNQDGP